MNNSVKKFTALFVSASMLLSLTACGDKAKDQVIEAAGSVAEALKSQKMKSYKGLLNEDAKKYDDHVETMEAFFEFLTYDDADAKIYGAILDTFEYEIDEKSATATTKSAEGSVDVTFTYADAKKVAKDEDNTTDIDTFLSALKKADTTETTVTMEFELVDDEWLLTNFSDIEKFLESLEVDVTFTPNAEDAIDYIEWWWADDENSYDSTSFIELDVVIKDEFYDLEWNYDYTVKYNGEVVFESKDNYSTGFYVESYYGVDYDNCPTTADGWYMAEGTYEITVVDSNTGDVIAVSSCTVTAPADVVETSEETTTTTAQAPAIEGFGLGFDMLIAAYDNGDEEIVSDDGYTSFFNADFMNSLIDYGWWDYDSTMVEDGYSTETVTMAYSIEVDESASDAIYFEYYYLGAGVEMIYSDTITPTSYTNGTYYDVEFAQPDGFEVGPYLVVVLDASQSTLLFAAAIDVVE